ISIDLLLENREGKKEIVPSIICFSNGHQSNLCRNDTLKLPDDTEISIFLHSERDEFLEENGFRIDSYLNALSTNTFGRFLLLRISFLTISCNSNFSDVPLGTVCVADVQFKGRGRSKNLWESPPGCLMFSFTIQMEDGRIVPLLQYVISLAIIEAIKDLCDKEFQNFPGDLILTKSMNNATLVSGSRGTLLSDMVAQGLTSSGHLLAIGDDSQMCELHPDGNSLFELYNCELSEKETEGQKILVARRHVRPRN
ncbi:Biotin--protein ligase 2, partial [Cucurbita argyrosperma subsp. argyrosperma]